ncbi:ribosomal protein S8A [Dimargaris verticillata]|uniref:40S ribosomal protein S8 n=1 Tax=Dimargaris verticillata TaxID=2761393 RepID=A0A9W8BD22_9FUNG|nr:ribosomal protein S8A [Dimargaris verticillata]
MGISQASRYKRSHTGAKRSFYRKKRKFELGRPAANTKLGAVRVHAVRTRGGNQKQRALRLDSGSYSWGSEGIGCKSRISAVVYNASNNELVRTNTLVKGAIVQIDAAPFRQWFENHYALPLGRKFKGADAADKEKAFKAELKQKLSPETLKQVNYRQSRSQIDPQLKELFDTGRLYAAISSRPGQCGRADGYILEGEELGFYLNKIKSKK